MVKAMPIVSLLLEEDLAQRLDRLVQAQGYASRSEALREAIRNFLADAHWESGQGGAVVISVLYAREMPRGALPALQHEYEDVIRILLHLHLDDRSCLEVLVAQGEGRRLQELVTRIRTLRGVRQVRFMPVDCALPSSGAAS